MATGEWTNTTATTITYREDNSTMGGPYTYYGTSGTGDNIIETEDMKLRRQNYEYKMQMEKLLSEIGNKSETIEDLRIKVRQLEAELEDLKDMKHIMEV